MNIEHGTKDARRATRNARRTFGSAIILVVVLTCLLAIIGVVFLLTSRVDSIATSAISENKELNLAVDTVIATISQELVSDVPGIAGQEYYDYPDVNNAWLASLEPNVDRLWPHITDLNYQIGFLTYNMPIAIVTDYQPPAQVGDSNGFSLVWFPADADGDGVSDSMWVAVNGISSNKSKHIFAAVRVIDNGGMLNVNTGFKFDPCNADGSSQMQINFAELSQRSVTNGTLDTAAAKLNAQRCNTEPNILYETNVIWQYGEPCGPYTPFDISDELKLRNRYILNYNLMTSRIEKLWTNVYDIGPRVPLPTASYPFSRWPNCTVGGIEPNDYDYRHIATIYNCDRIIAPIDEIKLPDGRIISLGRKMVNVNTAGNDQIYAAVWAGMSEAIPGDVNAMAMAAQITANLIDYIDGGDPCNPRYDPNNDVTVVYGSGGLPYFGFEQPCIYISELAQSFVREPNSPSLSRSYAIELYKPYSADPIPEQNKWRLTISSDPCRPIPVIWPGNSPFLVIENIDEVNAPLDVNRNDANTVKDMNVVFDASNNILLQRDVNGFILTVDLVSVPAADPCKGWLSEANSIEAAPHSFQRDITLHKCIRHLWDVGLGVTDFPTLGAPNIFVDPDPYLIQAHPENKPLTNIGEIGMVFRTDARIISRLDREYDQPVPSPITGVRVDLEMPDFQQIFKYLTVMDPTLHTGDPNQTRIKGRININTAPWFVLAQLPWVSQRIGDPNADYRLARAIVANRDTFGPFQNIGQLNRVVDVGVPDASIDYYWRGNGDLLTFPDLTPNDGAPDDFEERDVIFARISNLVTVRSDVFTAYILVRIGQDGPQKRVIAILDRSEVKSPADKVKVLAVYPVPDPR